MSRRSANRSRSTRTIHHNCPKRVRRGFTLVEVIVAVVLIDVGLLSLVAGSAVLIRRTSEARGDALALQTASNRLETLGASACIATSGNSVTPSGLREDWGAELRSPAVRELHDSVTYIVQGRPRAIVLRTRLPC